MEVYIEYVIIDNLIINTLILLATVKTMHLKKNYLRILLSAAIGTVAAVLYPLLSLKGGWLLLYKIACALLMVAVIARVRQLGRYLSTAAMMILYTFLAGGAVFGLIMLTAGTVYDAVNMTYVSQIPIGIIVGLLAAGVLYTYRTAVFYSRRKNLLPYLRRVEVAMGGKTYELEGFVDSGNMLFDPVSGLPVMVAYRQKLAALKKCRSAADGNKKALMPADCEAVATLDVGYLATLDKEVLDSYLRLAGGTQQLIKNPNLNKKNISDCGLPLPCGSIEYLTAAGRAQINLYRPERIKIYSGGEPNIIYDVLVGLSEYKLGGGAFDILIHPALI